MIKLLFSESNSVQFFLTIELKNNISCGPIQTRKERSKSKQYKLVQKYIDGKYKSMRAFLRSPDSGDDINDSDRFAMVLGRKVKEIDNGTVDDTSLTKKCTKVGKYDNIEKLLIKYVDRREQLFERDKLVTSWLLLRDKILFQATQKNYTKFKCRGNKKSFYQYEEEAIVSRINKRKMCHFSNKIGTTN